MKTVTAKEIKSFFQQREETEILFKHYLKFERELLGKVCEEFNINLERLLEKPSSGIHQEERRQAKIEKILEEVKSQIKTTLITSVEMPKAPKQNVLNFSYSTPNEYMLSKLERAKIKHENDLLRIQKLKKIEKRQPEKRFHQRTEKLPQSSPSEWLLKSIEKRERFKRNKEIIDKEEFVERMKKLDDLEERIRTATEKKKLSSFKREMSSTKPSREVFDEFHPRSVSRVEKTKITKKSVRKALRKLERTLKQKEEERQEGFVTGVKNLFEKLEKKDKRKEITKNYAEKLKDNINRSFERHIRGWKYETEKHNTWIESISNKRQKQNEFIENWNSKQIRDERAKIQQNLKKKLWHEKKLRNLREREEEKKKKILEKHSKISKISDELQKFNQDFSEQSRARNMITQIARHKIF